MLLGSLGASEGYTNTVYTSIRHLARWDSGATSSYSWTQTHPWSWCLTFVELLPPPLTFHQPLSPCLSHNAQPSGHGSTKKPQAQHTALLAPSNSQPCPVSHDTAEQPRPSQFPYAVFYCIPTALNRSTAYRVNQAVLDFVI